MNANRTNNISLDAVASRRNAFTLIELLVVIAIISILAAILFPVFASAREKGRQSACLSNEKQIGVAILQYCQDYDEDFPAAFITISAVGTSYLTPNRTPCNWAGLVQPYIKNTQVFACPSEANPTPGITPGTFASTYGYNLPTAGFVVQYSYNYYIGGDNDAGVSARATLQNSAVPSPATVIMVTDSGSCPLQAYNVNYQNPTAWPTYRSTSSTISSGPNNYPTILGHTPWILAMAGSTLISGSPSDVGGPDPRHTQMTDCLYTDGHVKANLVSKIYTLYGQHIATLPSPVPGNDSNFPSSLTAAGDPTNYSPCLDPYVGCQN